MQNVKLTNGVEMPQEGFGVFQIPDNAEAKRVTLEALEADYRMVDTAAAYLNEKGVGEGIRESGIPRDEIFVTSKIWIQDYADADAAVDRTLANLGMDVVDLLLIHQPIGDYYSAWRALERAYRAGKVRAVGVANFYPHVLTDFCLSVDIKPMLNQVEIHPFFQQTAALETMRELGVQPQAWGSFAEGKFGIFTHPVLVEIGRAHGKTAAQVALRWAIQRGVAVIPKSVRRERLEQNLAVWDFALTDGEMAQIAALDKGRSEIVDHFSPAFVRFLHDYKIHD